MYIAVTGFTKTNNYLFLILPVVTFMISGYNHCVTDMFYVNLGVTELKDYLILIPTTIGNFLGSSIIPITFSYLDIEY